MAQEEGTDAVNVVQSNSPLPVIANICSEEGRWVDIDPPTDDQDRAEPNIIGNWVDEEGIIGDEGNLYPIKAGFLTETRENTESHVHKVFRTSKYNMHFRIKSVGDGLAKGQLFVREAEGYN